MKELLVSGLKEAAKTLGRTHHFWDDFADLLIAGKVRGIDPRQHFRHPRSPDEICYIIHKKIYPGASSSEVTPEQMAFYKDLIREVLVALDFKVE